MVICVSIVVRMGYGDDEGPIAAVVDIGCPCPHVVHWGVKRITIPAAMHVDVAIGIVDNNSRVNTNRKGLYRSHFLKGLLLRHMHCGEVSSTITEAPLHASAHQCNDNQYTNDPK